MPKWARWLLVLAAFPALLLIGGHAWDLASLSRIPDVGDPFDVDDFLRAFPNDVRDEENAFHFYSLAVAAQQPAQGRVYQGLAPGDDAVERWALASEALKARVEEERRALDLWRQGAAREKALYHRLEEMNINTILMVTQELRTFQTLALLEGSRLEDEGDMAGAWDWYRALLRSSRHSGQNGFRVERMVGAAIYQKAGERARTWMADPRVDADLLRQAQADLRVIDAMTPNDADVHKLDYLITLRATRDPKQFAEMVQASSSRGPRLPPIVVLGRTLPRVDPRVWLLQARLAQGLEAERTRRVLRLLWANHWHQFARPLEERPEPLSTDPLIYPVDETAPEVLRRVSAADLAQWYRALLARPFPMDFAQRFQEALRDEAEARARLRDEVQRQIDLREVD